MVKPRILRLIRFSILVLLALTVGCSHYVINSAGYIRPPKNFKFSYKKRVAQLKDNSMIDTGAIYYFYDIETEKNHHRYIRFYADGRFKIQRNEEYPKLTDINDVNKGVVGYYLLDGRVIKIQMYSDIDGGSDQLMIGIIDENGSVVLSMENPRATFGLGYSEESIKRKIEKSNFSPMIYKKTKIEGMTYVPPNW